MVNGQELNKCVKLLEDNGFKKVENADSEILSYSNNYIGIDFDIENNSIVFLDDSGDFLHIQLCYYSLLGALVEFRQIPINYISARN